MLYEFPRCRLYANSCNYKTKCEVMLRLNNIQNLRVPFVILERFRRIRCMFAKQSVDQIHITSENLVFMLSIHLALRKQCTSKQQHPFLLSQHCQRSSRIVRDVCRWHSVLWSYWLHWVQPADSTVLPYAPNTIVREGSCTPTGMFSSMLEALMQEAQIRRLASYILLVLSITGSTCRDQKTKEMINAKQQ